MISIGVFKRLTQREVTESLRAILSGTPPNVTLACYFLSERARDSAFVKRLGNDAYFFWTRDALSNLSQSRLGMRMLTCVFCEKQKLQTHSFFAQLRSLVSRLVTFAAD